MHVTLAFIYLKKSDGKFYKSNQMDIHLEMLCLQVSHNYSDSVRVLHSVFFKLQEKENAASLV